MTEYARTGDEALDAALGCCEIVLHEIDHVLGHLEDAGRQDLFPLFEEAEAQVRDGAGRIAA